MCMTNSRVHIRQHGIALGAQQNKSMLHKLSNKRERKREREKENV